MTASKQKPRKRPAIGGEVTTTRPVSDTARRKVVENDLSPNALEGDDENAAYEAELARQIALAKEIMQEDHELLRMLADR